MNEASNNTVVSQKLNSHMDAPPGKVQGIGKKQKLELHITGAQPPNSAMEAIAALMGAGSPQTSQRSSNQDQRIQELKNINEANVRVIKMPKEQVYQRRMAAAAVAQQSQSFSHNVSLQQQNVDEQIKNFVSKKEKELNRTQLDMKQKYQSNEQQMRGLVSPRQQLQTGQSNRGTSSFQYRNQRITYLDKSSGATTKPVASTAIPSPVRGGESFFTPISEDKQMSQIQNINKSKFDRTLTHVNNQIQNMSAAQSPTQYSVKYKQGTDGLVVNTLRQNQLKYNLIDHSPLTAQPKTVLSNTLGMSKRFEDQNLSYRDQNEQNSKEQIPKTSQVVQRSKIPSIKQKQLLTGKEGPRTIQHNQSPRSPFLKESTEDKLESTHFFGNPFSKLGEDVYHQQQKNLNLDKKLLKDLNEKTPIGVISTTSGGFSMLKNRFNSNKRSSQQDESTSNFLLKEQLLPKPLFLQATDDKDYKDSFTNLNQTKNLALGTLQPLQLTGLKHDIQSNRTQKYSKRQFIMTTFDGQISKPESTFFSSQGGVTQGQDYSSRVIQSPLIQTESQRHKTQLKERRKQSIDSVLNKDIFNQNKFYHLQSTQRFDDKLKEIKEHEKVQEEKVKQDIDQSLLYSNLTSHKINNNLAMAFQKDIQSKLDHHKFIEMIQELGNIKLELELNYKMYEKQKAKYETTPENLQGAQVLVKQYYSDIMAIKKESFQTQNELFFQRIKEATNIYRQLIRTVDEFTERKDLLCQMSVFWKSVVLLLDNLMNQLQHTYQIVSDQIRQQHEAEIEKMKLEHGLKVKSLEKLVADKEEERKSLETQLEKARIQISELEELLKDRNYELQKLRDPYNLQELKSLLQDLDQNIDSVQEQKQKQYNEMNQCMSMLMNYELEYRKRGKQKQEQKSSSYKPMITIPKRKQQKTDTTSRTMGIEKSITELPSFEGGRVILKIKNRAAQGFTLDQKSVDSFKHISEEEEPLSPTNLTSIMYQNQGKILIRQIILELDLFGIWMKNKSVLQEQKQCLMVIKTLNNEERLQEQENRDLLFDAVTEFIQHQSDYHFFLRYTAGEIKDCSVQTDQVKITGGIQAHRGSLSIEVGNLQPGKNMSSRSNNAQITDKQSALLRASPRKTEKGQGLNIYSKDQCISIQNDFTNEIARKFMKNNPIIQILKQSALEKNGQKTSAGLLSPSPVNTQQKMTELNIIKLIEDAMESKVKNDLEMDQLPYAERDYQMFTTYLYDSLIMQYGLRTIASKNIVMMVNGIRAYEQTPYGNLFARILGLVQPFFMKDSVAITMRSIMFFKEVQGQWVQRMSKQNITISSEQILNLRNGGECMIFDLLDELRIVFKDDREMSERILSNMKPDNYKLLDQKDKSKLNKFQIEFSVLKICYRISKLGKDLKYIYDTLDTDKSGSLEPSELLSGLKNSFNVFLSNEEADALSNYLDEDDSGDIDFSEFAKKVNLDGLTQKLNNFTISKIFFVDLMLKEWQHYLRRERSKITDLFKQFDDNGDGVLVLDEFEKLLENIEPSISKKKCLSLFKQTIDKFEDREENSLLDDKLSPDSFCQMVQLNKLGGFGKEFLNDYFRAKLPLKLAQSSKKQSKTSN